MIRKTGKPIDARIYDAWYSTPRGRWIGDRETALILRHLQPRSGESLLDVGCGTGYFTRRLVAATGGDITGVDINPEWLAHARRQASARECYVLGDARALPFATAGFDLTVSITSLCFIDDQRAAVGEILRVTRRRFAIGLFNRHSLLWRQKGRDGGGAYAGAHWHTVAELRRLFRGLPVRGLRFRTAIQLPGGGPGARALERVWPPVLPTGAFLLVAGEVADTPGDSRLAAGGRRSKIRSDT